MDQEKQPLLEARLKELEAMVEKQMCIRDSY